MEISICCSYPDCPVMGYVMRVGKNIAGAFDNYIQWGSNSPYLCR